jgi:hypothetical protein
MGIFIYYSSGNKIKGEQMSWAKLLVGAVVAGVVAAVAPEVIELIKDKIDDLGESDIVSI